jgi:hypothetical protein
VSLAVPSTWTAFHRLEIDGSGSSFMVGLDPDGTRLLRAWLHTDPCRRCGRDGGSETEQQRARHPLRSLGGWARSETVV